MMIDQKQHIVIFDAYNFIHRSRAGFDRGQFSVVFNFFRSLRAEVERHKPTKVLFVTEGTPRQLATFPEYKANRVIDPIAEPEKHEEMVRFHEQKDLIFNMIMTVFPVTVVKHEDFEADDTIYNIIKRSGNPDVNWTVLSTDTDFIQLLNEFDNVTLYNPIKKKNVEKPEYDYVAWKALRGDKTDNISGIKGIGDKTATKMVTTPGLIETKLNEDQMSQWLVNKSLIKLHEFTDDEHANTLETVPSRDWETVKGIFTKFGFNSIINDKSWNKFVNTLDPLFDNYDS
jgi:5'-3' exonuclease